MGQHHNAGRWHRIVGYVGLLSIGVCASLDRPLEKQPQDCDLVLSESRLLELDEVPVDIAALPVNLATWEAETFPFGAEEAGVGASIPVTREESDRDPHVHVKVEFIRREGVTLIELGIAEGPHPRARFPCLVVPQEAE